MISQGRQRVASQSFIKEKKGQNYGLSSKRHSRANTNLSPLKGLMTQTPHHSRFDSMSRTSNYDDKSQNISQRYDQKATRQGMRP